MSRDTVCSKDTSQLDTASDRQFGKPAIILIHGIAQENVNNGRMKVSQRFKSFFVLFLSSDSNGRKKLCPKSLLVPQVEAKASWGSLVTDQTMFMRAMIHRKAFLCWVVVGVHYFNLQRYSILADLIMLTMSMIWENVIWDNALEIMRLHFTKTFLPEKQFGLYKYSLDSRGG